MEEKYKLKVQTLGTRKECVREIRVLNKIVRYTDAGIELEADPRHAEIVVRDLGLTGGKISKVPGSKEPGDDKHRLEDETAKRHRRRMEAYQKVIRIYQLSDDPLSEEQQEEVDRLLDEARGTGDHIEDAEEPEEEDEKADKAGDE